MIFITDKPFQLTVSMYGVSILVFMLFRIATLITQVMKHHQNGISYFKDKIDTVIVTSIVWPLYLLYVIFQNIFNTLSLCGNRLNSFKNDAP